MIIIINSCKLWEFFGFSYLIPLWDAELADFFAALPFELRLNKKLYDNVLRGFFDNQKILFKEDKSLSFSNNCRDNLKQWIKRNLPFISKKKNIFEHDIFDFRAMTTSMMKEIQKAATEEPKLSAKKAVTKLVASLVFFAVMTGFFANGIMTAASLTFAHRCLSEGTTEIVECTQSIPDRLGYTEYSVTFDVENGEQQQETVVVPVKKAFFETCAVGDVLRYALYDGCFGEEYVELIGMM